MAKSEGIIKCEAAFERLLNGVPEVAEHVGLTREKITLNIVGIEAGFGKGYFNRDRASHRPLIALIESTVAKSEDKDSGIREQLRRAKNKAASVSQSELNMKSTLDKVLTQNLMLVERVRELEAELKNKINVSNLHKED